MSLNKIIVIGRLTRDPEVKTLSSGNAVANFSVAVDRRFKNQQGERETDFLDIVAWRKTAELVGQYCSKGMKVAVDGSLQVRTYQAQDGSNRKAYEIVADSVQFLNKGKGGGQQSNSAPPPVVPPDPPPANAQPGDSEDDLPF